MMTSLEALILASGLAEADAERVLAKLAEASFVIVAKSDIIETEDRIEYLEDCMAGVYDRESSERTS
jgi:hypothetical protein